MRVVFFFYHVHKLNLSAQNWSQDLMEECLGIRLSISFYPARMIAIIESMWISTTR